MVDQPRQPALHAVEQGTLGESLPLLPAPRLGGDELGRPGPHVVGGDELAGREDQGGGEIAGGSLVVDAERGEAVDLVAPQVDPDRAVGGRREHVDDRSPAGELAPVLDQLLPPVAELDEAVGELVGVDDVAGVDGDRDDLGGPGPEALEEGPHTGDDHGRGGSGIAESPQQFQPPAHRLHRRAHPLERQRLPRRERGDLAGGEELGEVVAELVGHRPGRAGDHERAPPGQPGEGGDRDRPRHLGHRQPRVRLAEGAGQGGFVAQERGEIGQTHGRPRVPHFCRWIGP